jgi:phosphotransferase system IIA component
VNLKGEGFNVKVKQGQKVKQGDLICEFDLKLINKKAPSSDVIVVSTPEAKNHISDKKTSGNITTEDIIMTLKK